MTYPLASLNATGLALFRDSLKQIRQGDLASLPRELLGDSRYADQRRRPLLTQIKLRSKLDAATYLVENIDFLAQPDLLWDVGMWSWLTVLYFDQVCPDDDGRTVYEDYRYILESDWRHYYRHLLAGPVRIYLWHTPAGARVLQHVPVHTLGDFMEQLASRQEIAACRGIIEAADILYWDVDGKRPKRGAAPNTRKPGTLRRFVDIIQQLDVTYDLYSMTGSDVASLLPAEFTPWMGAD